MWAAIKSDFKEFASSAVEETTAVASKVTSTVVTTTSIRADEIANHQEDNDDVISNKKPPTTRVADGSVLLASAALSMGERGLKGLSSVSSMIGGVVAPRYEEDEEGDNNNGQKNWDNSNSLNYSAPSSNNNVSSAPSSSATSLLAAELVDDEEEELGWDDDDDDDDDDDLDFESDNGGTNNDDDDDDNEEEEEELVFSTDGDNQNVQTNSDAGTNKPNDTVGVPTNTTDKENDDILKALQAKLTTVQEEKMILQQEYRNQTAELVELRARVEELGIEQNNLVLSAKVQAEAQKHHDEERRVLEDELEQLKLQLEQEQQQQQQQEATDNEKGTIDKEMIASLLREKEMLDEELKLQKENNEELVQQNQKLQESSKLGEEMNEQQRLELEEQKELKTKELMMELKSLQAELERANLAVTQMSEESSRQGQEYKCAIETKSLELEQSLEQTRQLEQSLAEMEKSYNDLQQEANESKSQLEELSMELQNMKEQMKLREMEHDTSFATAAADEDRVEGVNDTEAALTVEEPSMKALSTDLDDVASDDDWGDGDWGDDDDI